MLPFILGGVGLTILGLKASEYLRDEKNADNIRYVLTKAEKLMCKVDKKALNALGEKQEKPSKFFISNYLIERDFYTNLLNKLDKAREKFVNSQEDEYGNFIKFLINIKEDITNQIEMLELFSDKFVEENINAKLGLMEIKKIIKDMLRDITHDDFSIPIEITMIENIDHIKEKLISLESYVAKEDE